MYQYPICNILEKYRTFQDIFLIRINLIPMSYSQHNHTHKIAHLLAADNNRSCQYNQILYLFFLIFT